MHSTYSYRETLTTAERINWRIEEILGPEDRLDFNRPFLPESLAGVEGLGFLTPRERLELNQIRGHSYLRLFGLVEEFILPFVLDHTRAGLDADKITVRALLQFANEEAKHIDLFERFARLFREGFGVECEVIGPAGTIAEAVLSHDRLGVALLILHIEWMTQRHYIEAARDDVGIDPLFKRLLQHHWMEEAQHAKLDTLITFALAERLTPAEIQRGLLAYEALLELLGNGLAQQVLLDIAALERTIGRSLGEIERAQLIAVQERAYRRTFLELGTTHPAFVKTRDALARTHDTKEN